MEQIRQGKARPFALLILLILSLSSCQMRDPGSFYRWDDIIEEDVGQGYDFAVTKDVEVTRVKYLLTPQEKKMDCSTRLQGDMETERDRITLPKGTLVRLIQVYTVRDCLVSPIIVSFNKELGMSCILKNIKNGEKYHYLGGESIPQTFTDKEIVETQGSRFVDIFTHSAEFQQHFAPLRARPLRARIRTQSGYRPPYYYLFSKNPGIKDCISPR